jgi:hypothetical protein
MFGSIGSNARGYGPFPALPAISAPAETLGLVFS